MKAKQLPSLPLPTNQQRDRQDSKIYEGRLSNISTSKKDLRK